MQLSAAHNRETQPSQGSHDLQQVTPREHASIKITPREKEVLHLIAYEHSSKEIANRLFVSYETVNSHRKNMMEKLGVKNTAGLVRVAFEKGLMRVGQMAFILAFFMANSASAQVLNDDKFQIELYINFVQPLVNGDGGIINSQDEWVVKFEAETDTDNMAAEIPVDKCGRIFRVDPGEIVGGPDHDGDGVIDGKTNYRSSPINQAENTVNRKAVDISVRYFEDDTGDFERTNLGDCAGDDIVFDQTVDGLITIDESTVNNLAFPGNDIAGAYSVINSDVFIGIVYAWRYTAGEELNALNFGALEFNAERSHLNSNRIKEVLPESSTETGIRSSYLNYPNNNSRSNRTGGEVYYNFIVQSRSLVTISTDHPNTDANTSLILKNSDGLILNSNFEILTKRELEAGTYTIIVDATDNGGQFELSVLRERLPAPINDPCNHAISIIPDTDHCEVIYSSLGATQSLLTNSCLTGSDPDDDVWFEFAATSSEMRVEVSGIEDYRPAFDIYSISCPSESSAVVGCGGQPNEASAIFEGLLTSGQVYYLRVYDQGVDYSGAHSFKICISENSSLPSCDPVDNLPTCNDAIVVPPISWGLFGTIVNYEPSCIPLDTSLGAPACLSSYHGGDRWFSFDSPETGAITLSPLVLTLECLDKPIGIEIFGDCSGLVEICMEMQAGRIDTIILFPNTNYLMRATLGYAGSDTFGLSFTELCPINVEIDGTLQPLPKVVASDTISSNTLLNSTQSYDAGQAIILRPGFEVPNLKAFEINTDGCTVTPSNGS